MSSKKKAKKVKRKGYPITVWMDKPRFLKFRATCRRRKLPMTDQIRTWIDAMKSTTASAKKAPKKATRSTAKTTTAKVSAKRKGSPKKTATPKPNTSVVGSVNGAAQAAASAPF